MPKEGRFRKWKSSLECAFWCIIYFLASKRYIFRKQHWPPSKHDQRVDIRPQNCSSKVSTQLDKKFSNIETTLQIGAFYLIHVRFLVEWATCKSTRVISTLNSTQYSLWRIVCWRAGARVDFVREFRLARNLQVTCGAWRRRRGWRRRQWQGQGESRGRRRRKRRRRRRHRGTKIEDPGRKIEQLQIYWAAWDQL